MKKSYTAVAKRYAKALFDIALDQGALKKYQTDVLELAKILQMKDATVNAHSIYDILIDPKFSRHAKFNLLSALLSKLNLEKAVANCFLLIVKKSRAAIIDDFAWQFDNLCLKESGQKKVEITTTVAMDEKMKNYILNSLQTSKNASYEIKNIVDPTILGGFIFKEENFYYDMSTKGSLAALRQKIRDE